MSILDNLQMEDLDEERQELARLIGICNLKKLMEAYPGGYIYIPKLDKLERIDRNEHIRADFNGYNFRELAIKYRLTEVSIRSIVADKVREIRAQPMEGQLSIL